MDKTISTTVGWDHGSNINALKLLKKVFNTTTHKIKEGDYPS